MSPLLQHPFYSILDFFPSPKKSFELLVNIEPLAITFVAQYITDHVSQTKCLDPQVHELMDVEASDSNKSTSHFMIVFSSSTDSKDGSI